MNLVNIYIYYTDNEYSPAVLACSLDVAWSLHFTLTHSMKKGESGPHVLKVEIRDNGRKIDTTKGLAHAYCQLEQQLRIS